MTSPWGGFVDELHLREILLRFLFLQLNGCSFIFSLLLFLPLFFRISQKNGKYSHTLSQWESSLFSHVLASFFQLFSLFVLLLSSFLFLVLVFRLLLLFLSEFPVEGDNALRPSQRRLGMHWGAGDDAVFFISGIQEGTAADKKNVGDLSSLHWRWWWRRRSSIPPAFWTHCKKDPFYLKAMAEWRLGGSEIFFLFHLFFSFNFQFFSISSSLLLLARSPKWRWTRSWTRWFFFLCGTNPTTLAEM